MELHREAEKAERTRCRKNKKDACGQTEMQKQQKGRLWPNRDAKRTESTLAVKQRYKKQKGRFWSKRDADRIERTAKRKKRRKIRKNVVSYDKRCEKAEMLSLAKKWARTLEKMP